MTRTYFAPSTLVLEIERAHKTVQRDHAALFQAWESRLGAEGLGLKTHKSRKAADADARKGREAADALVGPLVLDDVDFTYDDDGRAHVRPDRIRDAFHGQAIAVDANFTTIDRDGFVEHERISLVWHASAGAGAIAKADWTAKAKRHTGTRKVDRRTPYVLRTAETVVGNRVSCLPDDVAPTAWEILVASGRVQRFDGPTVRFDPADLADRPTLVKVHQTKFHAAQVPAETAARKSAERAAVKGYLTADAETRAKVLAALGVEATSEAGVAMMDAKTTATVRQAMAMVGRGTIGRVAEILDNIA